MACGGSYAPPADLRDEGQAGGGHMRPPRRGTNPDACAIRPDCAAGPEGAYLDSDAGPIAGRIAKPASRRAALPQMSLSGDEGNSSAPAHVGSGAPDPAAPIHLRNDRTISAWQLFAARHNEKTQDRHLAAIREFETFVGGKAFARLTQKDASARGDREPSLQHHQTSFTARVSVRL